MKRILLLLAVLPVLGWAQSFDLTSGSLNYQSVFYPNVDSIQLTLDNTTGYEIEVEGIQFFSKYEAQPYFVKDSVFTLPIGQQKMIWVYFSPEQNIDYNMSAVIKTNFRGDYVLNLSGTGKFLNSYYNGSNNKSEEALKTELKSITGQGYQQQSYNVARDNMYATIDNVNGDVTCVYTGRVATFNTRPGANANSFNCEHTFPQGFFSQNLPMRSDVHHLFPTDVNSNSQRGNYPFGVVTGSPSWTEGGSKKGSDGSQTVFEPRDAQKGQVARALFYFVIRYQDYSGHVAGQESVLRTWYDQYLPTAFDIQRNDDIYALQNNRNPFVDYPQFLKRITKISGTSSAPAVKSLYVSRDTVDMRSQMDSLTYFISIVNSGNTEVNVTNFNISDTTNFKFAQTMSNVVLQPGNALEIQVLVKPTSATNVVEQLTFNTDATGQANVSIALLGDWLNIGVPENDANLNTVVYPNPTSSNLTVTRKDVSGFQVEIISAKGQTVLTKWVSNNTEVFDVSDFPSGVYIVKTTVNEATELSRFVVQ